MKENLFVRISNIQDKINDVKILDENSLADLKRAKMAVRKIKDEFATLIDEYPFCANVMNIFGKLINFDVNEDLTNYESMINKKINNLESKENTKEPECAGCTCTCKECKCDDYVSEMYDFTDDDTILQYNPLTGNELIDDYLDETLVKSAGENVNTFANLVAEYINTEKNYYDRDTNDSEISYLSNLLLDFVNFTMNR